MRHIDKDKEQQAREVMEKANYQVYSILRHVSTSGMSRAIGFYVIIDNEPIMIDHYIKDLLGYNYDKKHDGVKVSGCGMDMGFHVVYSLSMKLFSNKDGSYNHDGAYKLKNRWL